MGRLLTLIVRFPVCLAFLFALPSLICTCILISRQTNPDTAISIDTSWGQFKVEGDSSTVRLQMFEAARTTSYKKQQSTTHQSMSLALQSKAASRSLLQSQYRFSTVKTLTLIYTAKENILTRESIAKIHDIEARIMQSPGYESYCQLYPGSTTCVSPSSVINFLYPSRDDTTIYFDGKGEMLPDLPTAIKRLLAANRAGFTDRETSVDNPVSKTLITQFSFGGPLEGYEGWNDRLSEQVSKIREFINSLEPLIAKMDEDEDLGFRILRTGGDIIERQIDEYLLEDALTAIASFVFVFLLMWLYTRSFSLTVLGVLGMTMSFPPCVLICAGLYGTQFNVLSLVSLWVIAGIGADDIFVFVDMWKQTRWMVTESADHIEVLEMRIKHAFQEATSAMFVTSFTTAAAFFATGTSSVLPLRVFGIYLGLLVLYNYFLVITWFPVCLIAYEKAYHKYACCRKSIFFCCRKPVRVGISEPIPLQDGEENVHGIDSEHKAVDEDMGGGGGHFRARVGHARSPSPLDPCLEKYFKCLYKTRYCVLIGFVVFVAVLAAQIPRLKAPTDLPRLLPLDSNIELLREAKKSLQCSDCQYGAPNINRETGKVLECSVNDCGGATFPTAKIAPTSPTMVPATPPPTTRLPTPKPVTAAPTAPTTPIVTSPPTEPPSSLPSKPPSTLPPSSLPPSNLRPSTLPPSALSPTPLAPSPQPPSQSVPTPLRTSAPSTPTNAGALISWDLYSDENCNQEFTSVRNHSVKNVPNGACIDLHPEPAIAGFLPALSGRVTCDEPGFADSASTVEVFTNSDCSGGAFLSKRGAGDGCQIGRAPVNSGRIKCGTQRRSPTPKTPTLPPTASTPTPAPPTASAPTLAPSYVAPTPGISWVIYNDDSCMYEFTSVANHSVRNVPNGACVDIHPGPLISGFLPKASTRVFCEQPGFADSANSMYLYTTSDCTGSPAYTKQGAGDGCQRGQAPVNSGRVVCGTNRRTPSSPSSPSSPPSPSPSTPTGCVDDPEGILFSSDGATCEDVLEYVSDCEQDLSVFDPQLPENTIAKDVCPLSCNNCAAFSPAPSAPPSLAPSAIAPSPAPSAVVPTRQGIPTSSPTSLPTNNPPSPATNAPTPFPLTVQEALTIHFLWGVTDVNMRSSGLDTPGTPIFQNFFLARSEDVDALVDVMTALSEDKDARNPYFPLLAFKSSYRSGWPLNGTLFASAFRAWIASPGSGYANDVGFLEDPLRVAWIHGSIITYVSKDLEGSNLEPVYLQWEDKMNELNSNHPTVPGFQFAEQFVRMKVELAFITGLARSLGISSLLIALTIVCFTQNLLIMALTLVVILAVVISLLGFYVLWGWSFGAVEALATSLVSGLAVDYALHMGHSYNKVVGPNGEKVGRVERTRQALLGIGPSIMAASATTIFSMLVLLTCSTYLFVEIGIIVSTTLLLGVTFSLCVFNAALLCFGPEGDCGNVLVMMRGCYRTGRSFIRRLKGDRADMIIPDGVELN